MATMRSIAVPTGLIGGTVFALHISIPGCGNYPFIWPAVAGATAFWMASRASAMHRLRHGVLAALATAAIVGLIGLLGVSLVVFVAGHSQFSAVRPTSSPGGRLLMLMQAELTIATLCAVATIAAICGALASMPFVWWRQRRSGAPAA
jgi:hypothetical protein